MPYPSRRRWLIPRHAWLLDAGWGVPDDASARRAGWMKPVQGRSWRLGRPGPVQNRAGRGINHLLADAGEIKRRRQLRRQRRSHVQLAIAPGMREAEPCGVQELAVEAQLGSLAVDGVADDRVADGRQVDADRMRAAGLELDVEQRTARQHLADREMRDGRPGDVGVERDARRVAPVAPDRGLD